MLGYGCNSPALLLGIFLLTMEIRPLQPRIVVEDYDNNRYQNGYSDQQSAYNGYQNDYTSNQNDYNGYQNDYSGNQNDYSGNQNDYRGNQNDYRDNQNDYNGYQNNYNGNQDNYNGNQDNYNGNQDNYNAYQNDYNGYQNGDNRYQNNYNKDQNYQPPVKFDKPIVVKPIEKPKNQQDFSKIPGVAGVDYPLYHTVPPTGFSCAHVPYVPGMYANIETGCQAYHICHDGREGHQGASFLCTNGTLFNQREFACDWWYNVNCAEAPILYRLNLDPEKNPYIPKKPKNVPQKGLRITVL